MRNIVFFILFLTNINLFAQIDIKILDLKILPLDVFIDKNNEFHSFDDLFNANYGIYAKLLVSSVNIDTLLTSKDYIQLIEIGSEKILFHHWGNDIVLFSEMTVKDSPPLLIYTKPMESDTLYLFLYGGFTKVLYENTRRKFKCDDCNEMILRNKKMMERWVCKKTRLRLFHGNEKIIDIKCAKVRLITEYETRNYYLSIWKSMIHYQNVLNN